MQTPNEPLDDLEYLSQLGFEKTPASEGEIRMLKKRVRARFYPFVNSISLISVSLLAGALIGALVFYFIQPTATVETSHRGVTEEKLSSQTPEPSTENVLSEIQLDTLNVVKENFQKSTQLRLKNSRNISVSSVNAVADTLQVVILDPAAISSIPSYSLTERKLKFIINSPVIYIHDLKVSDYTSLYFKKNQFVKFTNARSTSAEYASGGETRNNNSGLKQEATYYLHEELAEALLFFKRGKYDLAIVTLRKITEYNKTDVNCDFYLGMCFYYKKSFSAAATYFDATIENPNNAFLQEAMYYKAVTLSELGNKKEASVLFKKIVEEGEFYSEKAKSLLDK